jgi:hypothetical protein
MSREVHYIATGPDGIRCWQNPWPTKEAAEKHLDHLSILWPKKWRKGMREACKVFEETAGTESNSTPRQYL